MSVNKQKKINKLVDSVQKLDLVLFSRSDTASSQDFQALQTNSFADRSNVEFENFIKHLSKFCMKMSRLIIVYECKN